MQAKEKDSHFRIGRTQRKREGGERRRVKVKERWKETKLGLEIRIVTLNKKGREK